MMGTAHRLRREFPPDQIRACADSLRRKFHEGTLATSQVAKDPDVMHYMLSETAVVVVDAELPESLRGRFRRVFIQRPPNSDGEEVMFALGDNTGIVCDSRKYVRDFWVCSMAEGVHAYRYQRL